MLTWPVRTPCNRPIGKGLPKGSLLSRNGLVFIELLAVIAVLGMLTGLALLNLMPQALQSDYDRQVQEFISTLKMAQDAAAQSDRRYAVMLDLDEGLYMLKPFFELDSDGIPIEEEIISTGYFTDQFRLEYVRFDDGQDTRRAETNAIEVYRVWLLAGRSGWQNSIQIGVLDADGNPYTIVVNRYSRVITMYNGEYEIPEPLEYVPF
ncbi:MAG: type II secretion system protein [Sedimentisphaerales bacterium]|nr:type II secretion system protein [Sedimentisphaerales bacterium]